MDTKNIVAEAFKEATRETFHAYVSHEETPLEENIKFAMLSGAALVVPAIFVISFFGHALWVWGVVLVLSLLGGWWLPKA